MHPFRAYALLALSLVFISAALALKCRSDEGFSEAELKRVARSCMRKMGENAYSGHRPQASSSSSSSYGHGSGRGRGQDMKFNFDGEDDDDSNHYRHNNTNNSDNDNYYGRGEHGDRGARGERGQRGEDLFWQLNRDHQGYGNTGRYRRSANQRSASSTEPADEHGRNASLSDSSPCVAHCFFEQLNMLGNDNYPDKHRVLYLLTREIRDRELRNFYADTIQLCFAYLETQRPRGACQFSRNLIACMGEYAKANCDDWQDYNVMFT